MTHPTSKTSLDRCLKFLRGFGGAHEDWVVEIEALQRNLALRNEQIDGYERQLGIDQAGAERTIGSELERLRNVTDVLKTVYRLAAGHATECQCRQCEIFELLEPIVGNTSPRSAHETSDKPVAWRYLADSAYEQRPRWVYFEENTPTVRLVAEGRTLEPLYSRGSPEEPAETHYWAEMRRCCTCQGNTIDPKCPVAFPHPWNRAQVKASASHVHVWEKRGDFGGASCKCGTRADGWYCPDSPDHLCHYEKGNFDQCDFCGLPEERK